MEKLDLIHEDLREIRDEIKELRDDNRKFLEKISKQESDLTWLKGSAKIIFTISVSGVLGLLGFLAKAFVSR